MANSGLPAPFLPGLPNATALEEVAQRFMQASMAANTVRGYDADLRDFAAWCAPRRLAILPADPTMVANYIAELAGAGARASTIKRRLAAISTAHQLTGYEPSPTQEPVVRKVWQGIKRSYGTAPAKKARVDTHLLRRLLATCDRDTLIGCRDAALLILDYSGAFPRGELVSLDRSDIQVGPEGVTIHVRRGQADQEGVGRDVGIVPGQEPETCPVSALEAWIDVSGLDDGPLFSPINRHGQARGTRLTAQSVALIVKRAVRRAGIDPVRYAAHSLRAGHAVTAARHGAPRAAIKRQTGHRSDAILEEYIRAGTLFQDNSSAYLGL